MRAVGGPLSARLLGGAIDWDAEAAKAAVFPLGFGNTSEFVQLDVFRQHGGKLIFYHGVSDPWFSSEDTVRYYQTLGSANGGADDVNRWSRLFLSPGVGHCAGGTQGLDQVDLLDAIVKWVEHDQAPDRLTATGDAFPGRARPLCAYPAYAQYQSGDTDAAASFSCQTPD